MNAQHQNFEEKTRKFIQSVLVDQYGQNLVYSFCIVLVFNPVPENLSDSRILVLINMTMSFEVLCEKLV